MSDRTENGPVEFVQPSPIQSPVQGLTYFTAGPSKIEVILIVGHRILDDVSQKFVPEEWGEMYTDHSEEDDGRTEGNLSW